MDECSLDFFIRYLVLSCFLGIFPAKLLRKFSFFLNEKENRHLANICMGKKELLNVLQLGILFDSLGFAYFIKVPECVKC